MYHGDTHNTLGGVHVGWSVVPSGDPPRDGRSLPSSERSLRMLTASSLFHMGGIMVRASTWGLLLCVSVLSLSACTTTKVRTFSADAAKLIFFHQEYGQRISIVCDSDRSAASFDARCVARPESAPTWSRQSHKGANQASTTLCRDWPAESLETPVPTTSDR